MGFIGATGNYGFFEPLTVVLCLPALADDPDPSAQPAAGAPRVVWSRWRRELVRASRSVQALLAACFAALGLALVAFQLSGAPIGPAWLQTTQRTIRESISESEAFWKVVGQLEPWNSLNTYGLFRVMTTERPSIELQGSDDRVTWKPYGFRWKEGPLDQPPSWCASHMPRLDWQLWFSALRPPRAPQEPWFDHLLERMLQGEPDVLALLAENPFPERPPRFVRAVLFQYEFTTSQERAETGNWWKRQEVRIFHPPVSLR